MAATVNIKKFRSMHPEFRAVLDEMLQGFLDEAEAEISAVVMGPSFDAAHRLLTAHKIAASPMGVNAKLTSDDGSTTYLTQFRDLVRKRASGYRVI